MSVNTTARLAIRRGSGADRLDLPVDGRSPLISGRVDRESLSRGAETIARFLGTGRYLAIQTCVVIVWISLNVALPLLRWDPYPFILLNLAFSTQAAYAAPLILLAQNRQDDRDRAALTEDRAAAIRMREDTEFLAREVAALRLAQSDTATRQYLRGELSNQLESLRGDIETLLRASLVPASPAPLAAPAPQPALATPTLLATPNGSASRTARTNPATSSVFGTSTAASPTAGAASPDVAAATALVAHDDAAGGTGPDGGTGLPAARLPEATPPDGGTTTGHLFLPSRTSSRGGRKVPIRTTRARIRDT
ncbi:Protein of unknown function (DUF1003) [Parafrankia irregularis]|uniref:DUF1003 domain-containing protein n=1 Tax=Parafrankia irregularis TaxID=795642 RepID=A0A0S4QIP5_9ACTN|nr:MULTISPECIES: DUF1003 domain-containing protein [Parafrankia]MBE3202975.1 DUF1003 domain-containing protein [Parafrankia sp. CH37]CUU54394.1 Protein of unknown function (DUF1003) [Parafrankia irregularis]